MRFALFLPLLLAGCGDLAANTVRIAPHPPPEVDPIYGFAGAVRIEANTEATSARFHLELFEGEKMLLRKDIGSLALEFPATIEIATETTAAPGSLRVELTPDGGSLRSFATELPPEFPARGGGLSSPVIVLDPAEYSDDAFIPLFGVRRGGRIRMSGPEGPFDADETVLRVTLKLE